MTRDTESTARVLRDSRFHRAALKADLQARDLAPRIEAGEGALRSRRQAAEEAEDTRVEAWALLLRSDFDLDARVRAVELEVLGAVAKDRAHDHYRACFPRGLTEMVAARGAEQQRAVSSLVAALTARLPEIAARHAEALTSLAAAAASAETAWLEAERLAAVTAGEERIARTELVRALQRSEGGLREIYPGDRARVRSYFRPARRGKKKDEGGETE